MITLDEIQNISLRKSGLGGYKIEDVDSFIDKVIEKVKSLESSKRDLEQRIEAQDKEMMLSFVSARNLYKCIFFGDQITHLLFDVDNSTFQSIMNSPAYKQGNIFEEIKTDFLIPLESYSISEPETIQYIINLSQENRTDAIQYIFVYDIYRKKLEKLAKIDSKFKKSFAFVEYVQKLTTSIFKGRWEKKIKYISENLDDLITDFYSMYKEP